MVICLEQSADLHMAQLMPLPLTVSCFIKIQIGFTFLVPAHPGSPGKRAIKWVCVYICVMHAALFVLDYMQSCKKCINGGEAKDTGFIGKYVKFIILLCFNLFLLQCGQFLLW